MGCCAGAQQMCFNAAKSWYSGWYNDPEREGHVDVSHFDAPGQWWNGDLVGLDDYLTGNFDPADHGLLLRTKGGLYTMFNRMKGVNAGVKAYRDEVVIVQQWGEGGKSNVMAVLGAKQKGYTFSADYYDFDVEQDQDIENKTDAVSPRYSGRFKGNIRKEKQIENQKKKV